MYEDPKILAEYLLFHYGSPEEILPWDFGPKSALNFPVRTVAAADPFLKQCAACEGISATPTPTRALDLGCAVGRSSFELARRFTQVIGLDYSRQFIQAAQQLAQGQPIPYQRLDEGELETTLTAQPPPIPRGHHIHFAQADAQALPDQIDGHSLKDFDLIHAANLLCRLQNPAALLQKLPQLLKPGGLLLLATPASWLADFTPQKNWLGGFTEPATNKPQRTLDGLRHHLDPHLQLLQVTDLPFLIREHSRKFQWSVSQFTIWEH